jgi:hypothetical protein
LGCIDDVSLSEQITKEPYLEHQLLIPPVEKSVRPSFPASQTLLTAISRVNLRSHAFSPNGEWVIQDIDVHWSDGLYTIGSTISSNVLSIQQENLESSLVYYAFGWRSHNAWSPNSDAFYITATDKPAAGCPFTYIVIHTIELHKINSAIFNGEELGFCIIASWSPDGESLAITANDAQVIYIIDKSARVKQVIDIGDHDYFIDDITWFNGGIVLNVHYSLVGTAPPYSHGTQDEMILVKLDGMEIKPIFSSYTDMFRIIGADSNSQKILIKQWDYSNVEEQLIVYDLATGNIETTVSVNGNINGYQGASSYVAFSIQDKDSKDWYCCWSFSWETRQVEYLGEQDHILSWFAPEDGFVFTNTDQESESSFVIIQP